MLDYAMTCSDMMQGCCEHKNVGVKHMYTAVSSPVSYQFTYLRKVVTSEPELAFVFITGDSKQYDKTWNSAIGVHLSIDFPNKS